MPPDRRIQQPSLVRLAAEAIRDMVLSGDLRPGDRLVEERVTSELGISRPPLREALRVLEQEGLLVSLPRRGVIVTTLSPRDVYEIFTLRTTYEKMAIELGVPVREPQLLGRVRLALGQMEDAAKSQDGAKFVRSSFEFHLSIVGLAGHRRLEDAYRGLSLQLRLYMAANTRARAEHNESLEANIERHRRLLAAVEKGDPEAVLAELANHGARTFLEEVTNQAQGPEAQQQGDDRRATLSDVRDHISR
jgi:DNA-binding GntR family transcriptional regulator